MGCRASRLHEFERLLRQAYTQRQKINAQQARIDLAIAAGCPDTLQQEWQALSLLVVERKAVSHGLRSVFDT